MSTWLLLDNDDTGQEGKSITGESCTMSGVDDEVVLMNRW